MLQIKNEEELDTMLRDLFPTNDVFVDNDMHITP